jgi:hypothetical protein
LVSTLILQGGGVTVVYLEPTVLVPGVTGDLAVKISLLFFIRISK